MAGEHTKSLLTEDRIPTHWLNLVADLPGDPLPPLSPRTGEPAGPEDLTAIFPMGVIQQEVTAEPDVAILTRCATPTGSGVRRRCSALDGSSRRSTPRPTTVIGQKRSPGWRW